MHMNDLYLALLRIIKDIRWAAKFLKGFVNDLSGVELSRPVTRLRNKKYLEIFRKSGTQYKVKCSIKVIFAFKC